MFEVIISHVQTGRVRRAYYATRDEAQRHVAKEEERILFPRGSRPSKRSLRDYRLEIVYREPPAVRQLPASVVTSVAA